MTDKPKTGPVEAAATVDAGALAAFDREIEKYSFLPHWRMNIPKNTEPQSKLRPMLWRWKVLREQLMRAGDLITVDDAGRRTLGLRNPGLHPLKSTTHTLQMSIQLVLPGEVAAAHRHTMAALRFVLEGSGAGTPAECVPPCLEIKRHLVKLGFDHLVFGVPLGPDVTEALELLGKEVIPAVVAG